MNAINVKNNFNFSTVPAWDGIDVSAAETAKEALAIAGLDWEVSVESAQTAGGINIPKVNAVVRLDNNSLIGVVGKNYTPVQNVDSLGFFDDLKAEFEGFKYVSAGCFNEGSTVWLLADLGSFELAPGDVIRKQVVLFANHDGSTGMTYSIVPNRQATNSQVTNFMSGEGAFKIKGPRSSAKQVAQDISRRYSLIEQTYRAFDACDFTDEMVMEVYDRIYPITERGRSIDKRAATRRNNIRLDINTILDDEICRFSGEAPRTSALNVYNAVTEYLSHHTQVNKGGGQQRRWEINTCGKGLADLAMLTKTLKGVVDRSQRTSN